ncbi:hypothetical protein PSEUDO9AG_10669 [Pseudomonas sp. 9Ag]|nr:hypothetical protein PSEUDO9AG_10669 [Pseudomonas sp. 9Ag]
MLFIKYFNFEVQAFAFAEYLYSLSLTVYRLSPFRLLNSRHIRVFPVRRTLTVGLLHFYSAHKW